MLCKKHKCHFYFLKFAKIFAHKPVSTMHRQRIDYAPVSLVSLIPDANLPPVLLPSAATSFPRSTLILILGPTQNSYWRIQSLTICAHRYHLTACPLAGGGGGGGGGGRHRRGGDNPRDPNPRPDIDGQMCRTISNTSQGFQINFWFGCNE